MEEQLDALILQGQKNNEETNGLLEALIVQNKNNNTQPEIEALIVQNNNLTKTVKSGRDKIVEAVKELKTEPIKELSISNPDDISKAVVERLGEFESTIKEYFAQKLAVEKEKDSKRSKHTTEREKSLDELKNGIIKAIESLSKNIPKSLDYSKTLQSILSELENKEVNLSIVENGLKTISDEIKKILPDKLIDNDRVKVVLSDEQIKKLLDGLNIQVTNSSSEYAVNVNGTRINRATVEKQDEIKQEIIDSQTILNQIEANQGNVNSAGNKVISTYLDKFRDDFYDLSNWDVVQVGSGMSYELRGVANGSRFLAINSGTTSGEETILKAKSVFTVPFKIAFGASVTLSSDTSGAATSGRQTNLLPIFEIVECDDDGNVVETGSAQTYSGLVPNCMAMVFDGTTVTTQRLVLRSSGNSEWQAATAMGTYSSTTPSGSWPNYIQVGNQIMITNNEFANYLSERADTTTTGTNIKRNTSLIDPTKKYTIRIRLKNNATVTPADFNIHMVRVMDASRVSVDFGLINGSYADAQQAIPVYSTGGTYVVYENPSTSYGNALYHTLISDASINATNIKATACLLTSLNAFNRADYSCFLKTYSKATVPNPATDTPTAIYTLRPGNNDLINLGRYAHRHTLGLSYIITKNPDLTDTTPIDAGDVILNISYA